MNKFGERLRDLRKSRGMTVDALAALVQAKRRAFTYWEAGKTEPSFSQLEILATIFGVSTDFLLGREDDPRTASDILEGPGGKTADD